SWATIVEPGQGDLSISRGQGFKPIHGRATASAGDSVMVGPGGTATVTYDDGCKVNVQPGAVATIAPLSPCASGSNAQDPNWWNYCQTNPQICAFWAVYGAGLGFIIYEITRPSSPYKIATVFCSVAARFAPIGALFYRLIDQGVGSSNLMAV